MDAGLTVGAGDASDFESQHDGVCTAPSVMYCSTVATGICDPVCQTGSCDWCDQKCSLVFASSSGSIEPVCTSRGAGTYPSACAVTAVGSSQQSDDCAPGSICLAPTIGDSFTYCFGLCRSPADCAYGVACGARKLSAW